MSSNWLFCKHVLQRALRRISLGLIACILFPETHLFHPQRVQSKNLQLHLLFGRTNGFFYSFRLGVIAVAGHVVRKLRFWTFPSLFYLFLNSRKRLSFPSLSVYIFFFVSTIFNNICLKTSSLSLCAINDTDALPWKPNCLLQPCILKELIAAQKLQTRPSNNYLRNP